MEKKIEKKRDSYCKRCKRSTTHKILGEGSGNTDMECLTCGNNKFLIQGFDSDLM